MKDLIRSTLYLIVFFHWLYFFPHAEIIYSFLNPGSLIPGATILIEDFLALGLGMFILVYMVVSKSLIKTTFPVLIPTGLFFAVGGLFFVISILGKGTHNLLADFRLFFFGIFAIGSFIAIDSFIHLKKFLAFIVLIWIVEILFSYGDRFVQGGALAFGKQYYISRLYQPFGALIAVYLMSESKSIFVKYFLVVILAIFFLNVLLESTRATWMYLIVAGIFYSVLNRVAFKHFGLVLVILIVGFGLVLGTIGQEIVLSAQEAITLSGSAFFRLYAWQVLFERILDKPLLGHGLGAEGAGIDMVLTERFGGKGNFIGTAHNAHLILMYHIGIIGVISYLWYAGHLCRKCMREVGRSHDLRKISSVVMAGLAGFMMQTFTQPLTISFHYYFWYYLMLVASIIAVSRKRVSLL